ncbi:MAG TPA: CSLREA domain-containing protein [Dokdonella sp.]
MLTPARLLLCAVLAGPTAHAATITVTSTADTVAVDGACTLREAITASNNNAVADCGTGQPAPVVDVIAFAIPGGGPHVIRPATYLGAINESLTIDGTTQAGAIPNGASPQQGGLDGSIAIELSGEDCTGCTLPFGFGLSSGEFTLRGVAIDRYPYPISQASGTQATFRFEGCHIGAAADGLAPGTPTGIAISGGNWHFGGLLPAQRNLIVASLFLGAAASITMQGNLVGTDRSGLEPQPIAGEAMQLRVGAGQSALIGGSEPAARNVIASASSIGVHLLGFGADGAGLRVEGNHIGVGIDGLTPLPNGAAGVRYGNSVPFGSGWPRVSGNTIAWNAGPGVEVAGTDATVAEVVGNSMHDNAIGIDIDGNGPTPNDPGDADAGPNLRMNHPELRQVAYSGGEYAITWRVDTEVAHAAYPLRIDVYVAANPDDAEGSTWIGSDTIDAPDAQAWRTLELAGPGPAALVATVTDAEGRTSEFSAADRIFADGLE